MDSRLSPVCQPITGLNIPKSTTAPSGTTNDQVPLVKTVPLELSITQVPGSTSRRNCLTPRSFCTGDLTAIALSRIEAILPAFHSCAEGVKSLEAASYLAIVRKPSELNPLTSVSLTFPTSTKMYDFKFGSSPNAGNTPQTSQIIQLSLTKSRSRVLIGIRLKLAISPLLVSPNIIIPPKPPPPIAAPARPLGPSCSR